jgi:putative mRNA 3-end processing factor
VLATAETLAIMRQRYGASAGGSLQAAGYGERVTHGDASITLVPAGHVLGSAQVVIEYRGCRVVVSGDYRRRPDPTCAAFEPQHLRSVCDRGDIRPAGVPPSAGQP